MVRFRRSLRRSTRVLSVACSNACLPAQEQSRALRRHDEARPERRQFCRCVSSVLRGHGRRQRIIAVLGATTVLRCWHVCVGVSSPAVCGACVLWRLIMQTHRALHVRLTRASNLKTTLDRCLTSRPYHSRTKTALPIRRPAAIFGSTRRRRGASDGNWAGRARGENDLSNHPLARALDRHTTL